MSQKGVPKASRPSAQMKTRPKCRVQMPKQRQGLSAEASAQMKTRPKCQSRVPKLR